MPRLTWPGWVSRRMCARSSAHALGDGSATIGRAIVDEQQLPVGVGLGTYAGDRLVDEALGVEVDQHHVI